MIVKKGSRYEVRSKDGKKRLGAYGSKAAAEKRLRQVEYFKQRGAMK